MSELPKSVWVRMYCAPDEMGSENRKQLRWLQAVLCGEEGDGWLWRIPLRGADFQWAVDQCRKRLTRYSGPYQGTGYVMPATGSGTAVRRNHTAAAYKRMVAETGNSGLLLAQMFPDGKPVLSVESPAYWPHEAELYFRLASKFPELGALCNMVDRALTQYAAPDYGLWLKRAMLLERWITGKF